MVDGASSRPLIGLSAYRQPVAWGPWERDVAFVPGTYVDVVTRAGGQPVIVPPLSGSEDGDHGPGPTDGLDGMCGVLDGLVLVGGGDLVPDSYGQPADPRTTGTSEARDSLELELVRRALDLGVPVLAVCRGMQVLNVALGGDLVQHLPDRTGSTAHLTALGTFSPIMVSTEPGSRVRSLCGERTEVRCHHHQAVDRLGRGLRPTAYSEDGVVEATELEGEAFVVGVQWHPEEPGDARLFEGLVKAARGRRAGSLGREGEATLDRARAPQQEARP